MPIKLKCPHCQAAFTVPEATGGKRTACPQCQRPLNIPQKVSTENFPKIDTRKRVPLPPPIESKWRGVFKKYWLVALGSVSVALVILSLSLVIFTGSFLLSARIWFVLVGVVGCAATLLAAIIRGLMAFRKINQDTTARKHYLRGLLAGLTFLALAVLVSKHSESVAVTMLHYVSLIVAICTAGLYATAVSDHEWLNKASVAAALISSIVWWNFDYSIQRWSKDGESDGLTSSYEDYVRRGETRPFYREYSTSKKDSYLTTYSSQGALTDTGKLHGKWAWRSFIWDTSVDPSDRTKSGNDFYWYGEKITTEGEWHLRNK